ncbi:MAG TPA: hypothetical protein VNT01_04000 [Symbiobacteriaceae bacterium]|nr:hypothetical protein [Symbiobacteriaceae bacterium]
MSRLVRLQAHLDSADVDELRKLVKTKGGQRKGYTLSRELNAALREYINRHKAQQEEASMTPVWEELLGEKFAQQEAWLRPGVWGGATYSATAALLLLEIMCGKTLDPSQAKDHFELIRGRAWKIIRRDELGGGS